MEYLLSKGADINIKDYSGRTPLNMGRLIFNIIYSRRINYVKFSASRNGHKDIVEYLLAKGADVNIEDYYGRIPLHLGELIFNIIDSRRINYVSLTASKNGHKDIVVYLLSNGSDVNAEDLRGSTSLQIGE